MRFSQGSFALLLLAASCVESSTAKERNAQDEPETPVAMEDEPAPLFDAGAPVTPTAPPITNSVSDELPAPTGPLLFASLSDAGPSDDAAADAAVTVTIEEPTTVLVILDKSGSMASPWSGGDSRWVAANKALIGALAPAREQLTIGAILFPLPSACAVNEIDQPGQYPFMPGEQFIDTWMQTIRRNAADGSTPLEQALRTADRAIGAAGGLLERRFMVIVITDGEPTCMDDVGALESLPASWLARGIRTHVMGLPGSESGAQLLNRVAQAGGSERYVPIGTADQLMSELNALL